MPARRVAREVGASSVDGQRRSHRGPSQARRAAATVALMVSHSDAKEAGSTSTPDVWRNCATHASGAIVSKRVWPKSNSTPSKALMVTPYSDRIAAPPKKKRRPPHALLRRSGPDIPNVVDHDLDALPRQGNVNRALGRVDFDDLERARFDVQLLPAAGLTHRLHRERRRQQQRTLAPSQSGPPPNAVRVQLQATLFPPRWQRRERRARSRHATTRPPEAASPGGTSPSDTHVCCQVGYSGLSPRRVTRWMTRCWPAKSPTTLCWVTRLSQKPRSPPCQW